jgi:hypothetical protein
MNDSNHMQWHIQAYRCNSERVLIRCVKMPDDIHRLFWGFGLSKVSEQLVWGKTAQQLQFKRIPWADVPPRIRAIVRACLTSDCKIDA